MNNITTLFNGVYKNLTYKDFRVMSDGTFIHKDNIKRWVKNNLKYYSAFTSPNLSISM